MANCRGLTNGWHTQCVVCTCAGNPQRNDRRPGSDLQAEGKPRQAGGEAIHRAKTGALLSTSVWPGAYLGGARDSMPRRFWPTDAKPVSPSRLSMTCWMRRSLMKLWARPQARIASIRGHLSLRLRHGGSRRIARQLTEEACGLVRPWGSLQQLIEIAGFRDHVIKEITECKTAARCSCR